MSRHPHPDRIPLPVQAAKASWAAPLLAVAVSFFTRSSIQGEYSRELALGLLAIIGTLTIAGVAAGVYALFGIRKYGTRGILIPAVIGLLLSSGLLYLLVSMFQIFEARKQADTNGAARPKPAVSRPTGR